MTRKRLYFSFRVTKTICFVINKIFYSVYQCSRLHIHVQTVYTFVVINPPPKQRVCQLFVLYFCLLSILSNRECANRLKGTRHQASV